VQGLTLPRGSAPAWPLAARAEQSIDSLVEQLYDINKRLVGHEGRLMRLAENRGVAREDFRRLGADAARRTARRLCGPPALRGHGCRDDRAGPLVRHRHHRLRHRGIRREGGAYLPRRRVGVGRGDVPRCIALATGEETADEIAREAGEIRMAGESVRWIDLAATRNGAAHIFDRIPMNVPGAERAKWAEERCGMIRDGCQQHHGVTIEHFIEHVIRNHRTVQKDVQTLRQKFLDRVVDTHDDPVVRHLARCFGHVYAAAVIGVQFKTLPWSTKTVRKCIERCYRDARRELNTEADLLRDGLRIMHAKIRALPKANDADLKSAEGFKAGGMSSRVTIRADAFKRWFPDVRQPNLVLKSLRSKNALPSRPTPPTKNGLAIVWAESQPTWPDDSRPRSIVIDERPGQPKI
jgi:hypothetical protein